MPHHQTQCSFIAHQADGECPRSCLLARRVKAKFHNFSFKPVWAIFSYIDPSLGERKFPPFCRPDPSVFPVGAHVLDT
jgi:hypothetical protein